jgi:hypothetical protein
MTAQMPFEKQPSKTNAHGVTAPVRPRKIASTDSFDNRLKRVTTKHRKAIESLAKR